MALTLTDLTAPQGFERLVLAQDPQAGLRALICLHSTTLGPAAGGCRMWAYADDDAAIHDVTGRTPVLSTTGGTSDARFIRAHCPVVEFGLVGNFMHQVDERVPVKEISNLSGIYHRILERFFA